MRYSKSDRKSSNVVDRRGEKDPGGPAQKPAAAFGGILTDNGNLNRRNINSMRMQLNAAHKLKAAAEKYTAGLIKQGKPHDPQDANIARLTKQIADQSKAIGDFEARYGAKAPSFGDAMKEASSAFKSSLITRTSNDSAADLKAYKERIGPDASRPANAPGGPMAPLITHPQPAAQPARSDGGPKQAKQLLEGWWVTKANGTRYWRRAHK